MKWMKPTLSRLDGYDYVIGACATGSGDTGGGNPDSCSSGNNATKGCNSGSGGDAPNNCSQGSGATMCKTGNTAAT